MAKKKKRKFKKWFVYTVIGLIVFLFLFIILKTVPVFVVMEGDKSMTLEVHSEFNDPGAYNRFTKKAITPKGNVDTDTLGKYKLKYSLMDYDGIINVSRNNEQVLYNSQYINYLRTGYNYDLKSKQRQEVAAGTGIGLSALGTAVGIALGLGTNNPLVTAGAVISGAISLSSQLVSYAKSMAEAEQGLERKLLDLQNQRVSVMNADDIDLLNAYSNNRAKLCLYSISDQMKSALYDLFYYCGYSCYEQKIPNINTRYWFNFLQCG